MSDDSILKSSLTRKEAKLIKFIRLQREIDRKTVEEQINDLLEKWEDNSEIISNYAAEESSNAYWLNSDYYKK